MTSTREALESVAALLAGVIDKLPAETVVPGAPERVEVWPEDDEHLRGEFWVNEAGMMWRHTPQGWAMWQPFWREWEGSFPAKPLGSNFTRAADPSQPRKFDSLVDVPDDVDRVTAWYGCFKYELERWPRAESGWLRRCLNDNGEPGSWGESDFYYYNKLGDIEEVIGHE